MNKNVELPWGESGFQIGGYYSPVHFEYDDSAEGECLEMVLHSDGQFPTEEEQAMIRLHICDFEQLENFVEVWGKKLRMVGAIPQKSE